MNAKMIFKRGKIELFDEVGYMGSLYWSTYEYEEDINRITLLSESGDRVFFLWNVAADEFLKSL